uniref:coagulation factor V-like isoform X2 n=1 Tax=Myxine glutinosa TaxID=7769 RepID=UPI00358EFCEC
MAKVLVVFLILTCLSMHSNGAVRKYFLTAEETNSGRTQDLSFVRYRDSAFRSRMTPPPWQGKLGPILKGEVGDSVSLQFLNQATRPLSLHAHGVIYSKASEGASYADGTPSDEQRDDAVLPGQNYTYTWKIPVEVAPSDQDPPCLTHPYYSHVDMHKDQEQGLYGVLLVCRKGWLNEMELRRGAFREFALLFAPAPRVSDLADFTINGFQKGRVPILSACAGALVAFYMLSTGKPGTLFTVHLGGHPALEGGQRLATIELPAGAARTVLIEPARVGNWELTSQLLPHMERGPRMVFSIRQCPNIDPEGIPVRSRTMTHEPTFPRHWVHFIAAREVTWDYLPGGPGRLPTNRELKWQYVKQGARRIGHRYKKALFVGYTNNSFTTEVTKEPYLGLLGPVIKANIGDHITIVFKNMATRPYCIYPYGLSSSRNKPVLECGQGKHSVNPGESFTYSWYVLENAGPAALDTPCLSRVYASTVSPTRDIAAGLVGPLLICKHHSLDDSARQVNVDDARFLLFSILDENQSWYLGENIRDIADRASLDILDPGFMESNLMASINGYMHGTLPGVIFTNQIQLVSWHLASIGAQTNVTSVVFSGHKIITHDDTVRDTVSLQPFSFETVRMVLSKQGNFQFGCENCSPREAGMAAKFSVESPNQRELHPDYIGGDYEIIQMDPEEPGVEVFVDKEEDNSINYGCEIIPELCDDDSRAAMGGAMVPRGQRGPVVPRGPRKVLMLGMHQWQQMREKLGATRKNYKKSPESVNRENVVSREKNELDFEKVPLDVLGVERTERPLELGDKKLGKEIKVDSQSAQTYGAEGAEDFVASIEKTTTSATSIKSKSSQLTTTSLKTLSPSNNLSLSQGETNDNKNGTQTKIRDISNFTTTTPMKKNMEKSTFATEQIPKGFLKSSSIGIKHEHLNNITNVSFTATLWQKTNWNVTNESFTETKRKMMMDNANEVNITIGMLSLDHMTGSASKGPHGASPYNVTAILGMLESLEMKPYTELNTFINSSESNASKPTQAQTPQPSPATSPTKSNISSRNQDDNSQIDLSNVRGDLEILRHFCNRNPSECGRNRAREVTSDAAQQSTTNSKATTEAMLLMANSTGQGYTKSSWKMNLSKKSHVLQQILSSYSDSTSSFENSSDVGVVHTREDSDPTHSYVDENTVTTSLELQEKGPSLTPENDDSTSNNTSESSGTTQIPLTQTGPDVRKQPKRDPREISTVPEIKQTHPPSDPIWDYDSFLYLTYDGEEEDGKEERPNQFGKGEMEPSMATNAEEHPIGIPQYNEEKGEGEENGKTNIPEDSGEYVLNEEAYMHEYYEDEEGEEEKVIVVYDKEHGDSLKVYHLDPRGRADNSVRRYYIAAVEMDWDYGFRGGIGQVSRPFKKVVYQAYTDGSFSTPAPRGEIEKHLGILGPLIKAEVQDIVKVHFKNMASRPFAVHAHGLTLQSTDISPVEPQKMRIYDYVVEDSAVPRQGGEDCLTWPYYSNVDVDRDINSGLMGVVLTCHRDVLDKQPGHRFVLAFTTFDESQSWFQEENRKSMALQSQTQIDGVNGLVDGSVPGMIVFAGKEVTWHLIALGSDHDPHHIHFHGHTLLLRTGGGSTHRRGSLHLYPGVGVTAYMIPITPGSWLVHSINGDHFSVGMFATFLVLNPEVCRGPLGLKSGLIKDSQLTASSSDGSWQPHLARLDQSGFINAWSSNTFAASWLQVDLDQPMVVTGLMTQGASWLGSTQATTSFRLSYSRDGKSWESYRIASSPMDKVFHGIADSDSIQENLLDIPIIARLFRIYPLGYIGRPTLRLEILGCNNQSCSQVLGLESGAIHDEQIRASSFHNSWIRGRWYPHLARLHNQGRINAWQPASKRIGEWIEVDFWRPVKVTEVVTQGASVLGSAKFVTHFVLAFNKNNKDWMNYQEGTEGKQKVFQGNRNSDSIVRNKLNPPISAKAIRVYPLQWNGWPTLRLEFIGCFTEQ